MKEYPTLTALMAGREPGSVKVRGVGDDTVAWFRPGGPATGHEFFYAITAGGGSAWIPDKGPWLLVSDEAQKLDTLRLEIAAKVLAALHSSDTIPNTLSAWEIRHAYALAEADALIAEARK